MLKKLNSTKTDEFVRSDVAILLLRIGAAALILTHGFSKLMKIMDGDFGFMDPIGIGATTSLFLVTFAEFFCALLLLVGFFTRGALIPLIINFLVIIFIAHGDDPFGRKELPLLYLISFVTLFLTGPGKLSLDGKLFGSTRSG